MRVETRDLVLKMASREKGGDLASSLDVDMAVLCYPGPGAQEIMNVEPNNGGKAQWRDLGPEAALSVPGQEQGRKHHLISNTLVNTKASNTS